MTESNGNQPESPKTETVTHLQIIGALLNIFDIGQGTYEGITVTRDEVKAIDENFVRFADDGKGSIQIAYQNEDQFKIARAAQLRAEADALDPKPKADPPKKKGK